MYRFMTGNMPIIMANYPKDEERPEVIKQRANPFPALYLEMGSCRRIFRASFKRLSAESITPGHV